MIGDPVVTLLVHVGATVVQVVGVGVAVIELARATRKTERQVAHLEQGEPAGGAEPAKHSMYELARRRAAERRGNVDPG